jgi:hypothetical protein
VIIRIFAGSRAAMCLNGSEREVSAVDGARREFSSEGPRIEFRRKEVI